MLTRWSALVPPGSTNESEGFLQTKERRCERWWIKPLSLLLEILHYYMKNCLCFITSYLIHDTSNVVTLFNWTIEAGNTLKYFAILQQRQEEECKLVNTEMTNARFKKMKNWLSKCLMWKIKYPIDRPHTAYANITFLKEIWPPSWTSDQH